MYIHVQYNLVIIVQTIIGWIPYHFLQQYCAICHIINDTPCFVYLCREEDNSNTAARSASHIVLHAGWFVCNVYNNVPFCLTKVTKVAHYIYVHVYNHYTPVSVVHCMSPLPSWLWVGMFACWKLSPVLWELPKDTTHQGSHVLLIWSLVF